VGARVRLDLLRLSLRGEGRAGEGDRGGPPPGERLAVHLHDTRGTALANVLAALEQGIAIVDSAAGGLGGCPYAPGASGNLATEDLLYMLHGMGVETGVDLDKVAQASRGLASRLGRALPSRYLQSVRGASL
jgi:isopropylmalate/homocitrate/citramalate synthase